MRNPFVVKYTVDWIGEGMDLPEWLSAAIPLTAIGFKAQWDIERPVPESVLAIWTNNDGHFVLLGPKNEWTIFHEKRGVVAYWGHGEHNLTDLVSGVSDGFSWVSALRKKGQVDGSSPCSINLVQ